MDYAGSLIGQMMTERTLSFLFITAVRLCFDGLDVLIEHSLAGGLYGTLIRKEPVTLAELEQVEAKMRDMIAKKEPIHRRVVSKAEAGLIFEALGCRIKPVCCGSGHRRNVGYLYLRGSRRLFYGVMLPDASWIGQFTLRKVHQGFWLSTEKSLSISPGCSSLPPV